MKKLFKTLAVLAAVAALGFGFASCADDSDDGGSSGGNNGMPKIYNSTADFQPSNLKVEQIAGTNYVNISFDIPTKEDIDFDFSLWDDQENTFQFDSYGDEKKRLIIVKTNKGTGALSLYCKIRARGMVKIDEHSFGSEFAECVSEAFQFTPVAIVPSDLKIEAKSVKESYDKYNYTFDFSFSSEGADEYYFKYSTENNKANVIAVPYANRIDRITHGGEFYDSSTQAFKGSQTFSLESKVDKVYILLECYYPNATKYSDLVEVTFSK